MKNSRIPSKIVMLLSIAHMLNTTQSPFAEDKLEYLVRSSVVRGAKTVIGSINLAVSSCSVTDVFEGRYYS
jgi:hypothetical protein